MRSSLLILTLTFLACSSGTPPSPESTIDPSEPASANEPDESSESPPSGPSDTTEQPGPTPPSPGKPPPPTYPKDAGGDDANVPPSPAGFTQAEVQSLFNARCSPCHIGGVSGNMSLANDFTKATIGVKAVQAPALSRITKGDRNKSYLLHKLKGTHVGAGGSGVRMPKGGPYLSANEIERIALYIDGLE